MEEIKNKLFKEIIEQYDKEKEDGIFEKGIEEFLLKVKDKFNNKLIGFYPKAMPDFEKELLIETGFGGSYGYFNERNFQVITEQIKIKEIESFDLKEIENILVEEVINYTKIQNFKLAGCNAETANPMNIFGSIMFKGFVKDRVGDEIFEGYVYPRKDIYNFFYSENVGYVRIIKEVLKNCFVILLEEKNIIVDSNSFYVTVEDKNHMEMFYRKQQQGEGLKFAIIDFKDGYYQFWNDNEDRYMRTFNLNNICPDYSEIFNN